MIGGGPNSPRLGQVFEPQMVKEVMDKWLKDLIIETKPSGPWYDKIKKEPTVIGLFYSIKFVDGFWYNENWGAYASNEKIEKLSYYKNIKIWTFIFPGIDWTKQMLEIEIDKQIKEFLEYYKMERIKKDFV